MNKQITKKIKEGLEWLLNKDHCYEQVEGGDVATFGPPNAHAKLNELLALLLIYPSQRSNERNNPKWINGESEILRTVYWEKRCALAEKLLEHVFTPKEIGRACHIHDLERKIGRLQKEVTQQREAAEYRNRQLKAANLITLCSGGCDGGILGSQDKINEEIVRDIETIAERLRNWLTNHKSREARK